MARKVLYVRVELDGAAFEEVETAELRRILSSLADRCHDVDVLPDGWYCSLSDVNGNVVGEALVDHD